MLNHKALEAEHTLGLETIVVPSSTMFFVGRTMAMVLSNKSQKKIVWPTNHTKTIDSKASSNTKSDLLVVGHDVSKFSLG